MSEKEAKNKKETKEQKAPESRSNKVLTIIGIVLCAILIPMLIINCVLIIKSFVKKDEVPSLFGLTPMIVLTESMEPEIKAGDLIVVKDIDPKDVKVGDDISFFDPAGNGSSVVTHRVIEKIVDEDTGKISWKTKGINNNTEDKKPVPAENLVGIYKGFRVPAAGRVALFMQTIPGLIICVLVPLVLLVGYDVFRRKLYDKKQAENVESLKAELEALRAEKAAAEQKPAEAPTETVEGDVPDAPQPETAEEAAEETAEETPESDKTNDNE